MCPFVSSYENVSCCHACGPAPVAIIGKSYYARPVGAASSASWLPVIRNQCSRAPVRATKCDARGFMFLLNEWLGLLAVATRAKQLLNLLVRNCWRDVMEKTHIRSNGNESQRARFSAVPKLVMKAPPSKP